MNAFTRFSIVAGLVCGFAASMAHAGDKTVIIEPDVVYGHKHGMALTMDMFKPTKDRNGAGVLFMVSGGWYSRWTPPAQFARFLKPLTDKGFTVFAVRHGSSPKFTIPEIVSDVRRSVRFVRLHAKKFGVDPERLGVFGGSAGGHLSLMLATTADKGKPDAKDKVLQHSNRVAAVVAYYPPTDLRDMVWSKTKGDKMYKRFPALNLDLKKAAQVSPLLHVSADDAPALLVHGDKDKLVPLKHSQDIQKAFQEKKVAHKLVIIKGAAHGFRGKHGAQATRALIGWFEKHLVKSNERN